MTGLNTGILTIDGAECCIFTDEKKSFEKTKEFVDLLVHARDFLENAEPKACRAFAMRLEKLAGMKTVDRNASLGPQGIEPINAIPVAHFAARYAPFSVFHRFASQKDTDIDANVIVANTLTSLCLAPYEREKIKNYHLIANDTPHNDVRRIFHYLLSRPETDITRHVFFYSKKHPRKASKICNALDILEEKDRDLSSFVEQLLNQRQTFVLSRNLSCVKETFNGILSAVEKAKELRINPKNVSLVATKLRTDIKGYCEDLEQFSNRPFPSSEEPRILDNGLLQSKPFSKREIDYSCARFACAAIEATFRSLENKPRFPHHSFSALRNKALGVPKKMSREILVYV